jgi:hypothetical protein
MEWPKGIFALGQGGRIPRSTDRRPIMPAEERALLEAPTVELKS